MAWPTKPSATMQVPRRAEPYATAQMKARWTADVLPKYATRLGALMPILHDIQHAYRHIPYQAQLEIAEFLGISPSDVLDTVSFYDEYTIEQRGVVTIGVCHSIACEQCACSSTKLLDCARERLGIGVGETTDDGQFTLIAMDCLGSCDTAPVALFNETLHESLTVETLERLIVDARHVSPGGSTDMPAPEDPPLARNIGSFFGHIIDAIVSDPNAPKRVEVKKTVSEEQRPDGVTLRRTVIDEVLLPPDAPTPPPANDKHTH